MSLSSPHRSFPLSFLPALLLAGAGRASAQASAACSSLDASLGSSKVLTAGQTTDAGAVSFYEESTHYYDARSAENVPACIVLPTSADDISAAVLAIRAANSTFAIKAGGHTGNGDKQWSSTAGGVLIDLADMDDVVYDQNAMTVRYGGGQRFLNLYTALEDSNVAVVGGRLSDVGVGGWNVGGGLSYLSAEWGLGVDNYVALEVVLPNGQIVNATADNLYSDLFFALKGGGNQFGVVATFESIAHPVGTFVSGDLGYTGDQIPALLNATQQFLANYSNNPKAAIITTLSSTIDLPVPIVFTVYNGAEVPDGVFDMFTSIPHTSDTRSQKTYLETCTMNDFGSIYGPRQAFWSVPIRSARLQDAYSKYAAWVTEYAGVTDLVTLDLQPIPQSMIDYGTAHGGNAIFQGNEGDFFWLNFLVDWSIAAYDDEIMAAAYNWTQSVGAEPGIPVFLNDGDWMQNAVKSYAHYDTLVATQQKYDSDGFWTAHTGGPSYS